MHDKLVPILANKRREIALLEEALHAEPEGDLAKIMRNPSDFAGRKSLKIALQHQSFVQIIAEIKRRSPAKGDLAAISNPLHLAQTYVAGGAAAISVLTETTSFSGSLIDLQKVSALLKNTSIPVLRKDFLLKPIQIAESIAAGADAILLIVAILKDDLIPMLQAAKKFNIDAIVEVHTVEEAQIAVAAGAEIIGVNNRDLRTFIIDTERAFDLIKCLPETVVRIAESGIVEPELAKRYHAVGYDAVLIGETLVKSVAPGEWIQSCR